METGSHRAAQSTQQLIRYEALFKLLDDMQRSDDILSIAKHVARQWKYFSNVSAWRLVVAVDTGFELVDGYHGDARTSRCDSLQGWDLHFWQQRRPQLLDASFPLVPEPPEHLLARATSEIEVLPFTRDNREIALLSVAARHEPFGELDKRFIHLFGGYFVERIAGILFRQSALASLTFRATYDSLTGLLNRAMVIDRLENQLAHCERMGQPLGVVLMDVDFFKSINDAYGHLAGDAVLREMGMRINGAARRGEIAGRFGGEEFLLVLYPCDGPGLEEAAERFRRLITDQPFANAAPDGQDLQVTASLGACSTAGQHTLSVHELLRCADQALYQAKTRGRNCIALYADC